MVDVFSFNYVGGKSKIKEFIIDGLDTPHDIFVDVFGGAGNIILNKPKVRVNVFNDINLLITNFFRVVRDKPNEFNEYFKYIPYSREEFKYARTLLKKTPERLDDVQKAVYFYYVAILSFGGVWSEAFSMPSLKEGDRTSTFRNKKENINIISNALSDVVIENSTYQYIFEFYDSITTLFYCDPPYLMESRSDKKKKCYANEMVEEDHIKLLELCNTCKGKVVISGYPSPIYEDALKGWYKKQTHIIKSSKGVTKLVKDRTRPIATETMWIKSNSINKEKQLTFV